MEEMVMSSTALGAEKMIIFYQWMRMKSSVMRYEKKSSINGDTEK